MTNERKFIWYALRRIIGAIPLILLVISLCFFLIHAAPGDPVIYMIGSQPVSEEYIVFMRQRLGLDKPLYIQYIDYIVKVCGGDLGFSYRHQRSVLAIIIEKIPATILLLGTAYSFASLIGILLGVFASANPRSLSDYSLTVVALFGFSLPIFWMGLMAIYLLGFNLGWFPISGMQTLGQEFVGLDYTLDILRHLALPAMVLGYWILGLIFRVTRQSMLETLQEDFIITARAKGVKEKWVLFRHALKNSLRPIVTLLGMRAGMLMGGAVLTETVFAWPGMGRLVYEAALSRDYPMLLGCFVFTSIAVIITNLVVDLAYGFIDPRVRYK